MAPINFALLGLGQGILPPAPPAPPDPPAHGGIAPGPPGPIPQGGALPAAGALAFPLPPCGIGIAALIAANYGPYIGPIILAGVDLAVPVPALTLLLTAICGPGGAHVIAPPVLVAMLGVLQAIPPQAAVPLIIPQQNVAAVIAHVNQTPHYNALQTTRAAQQVQFAATTQANNAASAAALSVELNAHRTQSLQQIRQMLAPNIVLSPPDNDRQQVYQTLLNIGLNIRGGNVDIGDLLGALGFNQQNVQHLTQLMNSNFVDSYTLVQFYVDIWHPTRRPPETFESRMAASGISNQAVVTRLRRAFDEMNA